MDFLFHPTTFITANMNHQSESAESRYNLLVLCFFHIISPWLVNLRVLFESMSIHSLGHFNHTEVGWSRDWQEAPQSGATRSGQLQRIFRETLSRSIFLWRVPLGANGCHFCIFLSCFRASMKILGSLKKATITRPRVFFGDQKTMYEEFSPKWTSKMR